MKGARVLGHESVPIRGGNWNDESNAGAFTLNLDDDPDDRNDNLSFRPALSECPKSPDHGPASSATLKGPAILGQVPENVNRRGWAGSGLARRPVRKPGRSAPKSMAQNRAITMNRGFPMSETFTGLWPRITDFENIHAGWERSRLGHRYKPEVLRFMADLEPNLIGLQESLLHGSYRTGPYRRFHVFEPKKRDVAALPVKDRIVQHALVRVIEPIWEARFIHDSYACRPGKGTHAGADRAQEFLRDVQRRHGAAYALKGDIAKYFASVQHDALKRLLRRHIACDGTLQLLDEIIDSMAEPRSPLPRGIPIGNLTSQLFANIYLHELDRFAKEELRLRHYLRYMDDFVAIGPDKEELHQARRAIEDFVWAELGLRLNPKTQVYPVSATRGRGLDFLGYRIYPTHRLLRRDSIVRIRRGLKKLGEDYEAGQIGWPRISATVTSWVGHAKHADTFNLRRRIFRDTKFRPPRELPPDRSIEQ